MRQVKKSRCWAFRSAERTPAWKPEQSISKRPRAVDDVVVSVIGEHHVEIDWQPGMARDGEGPLKYVVERAAVVVLSEDQLKRLKAQTAPLESPSAGAIRWIGPFQRLTPTPIDERHFVDKDVDLSTPTEIGDNGAYERRFHDEEYDASGRAYRRGVFAYRVRAVSNSGREGGPSPAVLTIPSVPQHFFSKEDGTTCHLKWRANPERGIAGYRVYRMDGRYSKDAIVRLTEKPITELTISDSEAGRNSRRYYIVAVDALGQEGFPSSPVWFEREWKPFYQPFTGEWHQ